MVHFVALAATARGQEQDWIQSWVFNGRSEKSVRERFETLANQKIELLQTSCQLTEEQTSKLRLAVAGDISRFFHEVARVRQATAGLKMQDQNAVQEAWVIISPLATRVQQGIFEGESLLSKVLANTLNSVQQQEYNRIIEARTQRRYHAIILTTVATIEESLPLLEAQRSKLVALMDQQELKLKNVPNGYETYIGYVKLAKIPDSELAAFLDQEQLATIKRITERYAPILQTLR